MARRSGFWKPFAMGAAAGTGAMLIPQLVGRAGASRIIRLEKSIQIGRPVEEVFDAWTDWERLPRVSENVAEIRNYGNRSHWRVQVDGQQLEWDAIIEQNIPNQAIAWKTVRGPKHTGRITFSPLGNDTVVHVTMNYAPPLRLLRPFLSPWAGHMEGLIEKVLRDFKASVESRPCGAQGAIRTGSEKIGPGTAMADVARTGTFGDEPRKIETRFGGSSSPTDYPAPPDVKR
ncbi:MAG: SRPBCC family protein [Terriglobales bacterium]